MLQDASKATLASVTGQSKGTFMQIVDGRFKDDRWSEGRWILSKFAGKNGETDWDKVRQVAETMAAHAAIRFLLTNAFLPAGSQVIDAEIARRSLLEATPIPCRNDDTVVFDTSEVPWWAWVKRFHLPEVRKRDLF